MSLDNLRKCESCIESKNIKNSCKLVERELELLSLRHNALEDLKNTMTRGGGRFYLTFMDNDSRYTRAYILRNKYEARDTFIKYKKWSRKSTKEIKRLRTDRGK